MIPSSFPHTFFGDSTSELNLPPNLQIQSYDTPEGRLVILDAITRRHIMYDICELRYIDNPAAAINHAIESILRERRNMVEHFLHGFYLPHKLDLLGSYASGMMYYYGLLAEANMPPDHTLLDAWRFCGCDSSDWQASADWCKDNPDGHYSEYRVKMDICGKAVYAAADFADVMEVFKVTKDKVDFARFKQLG